METNVNKATEVTVEVKPTETKVENKVENKTHRRRIKSKEDLIPEFARKYPEHILNIALLIHNNVEIKRFTALGILNYLLNKGEIKGDHRYVVFKWNKFTVKYNELSRDYLYSEPFFLNALVASFASFSASAQKTIDTFVREELKQDLTDAVDKDSVEEIVNMNDAN